MTTAATSLLGLALPVTGELSGTWGDTVNNSITSLLDSAVAGTTTLSTDADVTLTTTTLAANQAREAIILWTAAGTVTRTITAPAQSKTYVVINSSSTQSIKLVGAGPTAGITVLPGESTYAAWNGSDFVKVGEYGGNLTVNSLTTTASTTGSTNKGPLNYGTLSFSDTGIVQSAQTSVNSYFQNVIQNTSAGTAASAEFIAYNDQGTASTNYATVGINSSGYTGTGSINAAGYAYFLSASTDLVLGTIGANGIHFTTNSSATDALAISSAGAVSLPGGAANGVAYLNGSKVVTTGSALTFNGGLGIGVASATQLLNLSGAGTSSIQIVSTDSGGKNLLISVSGSLVNLNELNGNPIAFGIGNSEQMRLTNTGLGIGTSSPAAKLDVKGGATISTLAGWNTLSNSMFELANPAVRFGIGYDSSDQVLLQGFDSSNGSRNIGMQVYGGNFGIGTSSPATKLHVVGNASTSEIRIESSSTVPALSFYSDSAVAATRNWAIASSFNAYGDLVFQQSNALGGNPITAGTTRMTLDSSGNLGLGVTPSGWGSSSAISPVYITKYNGNALWSPNANETILTNNAYYTGAAWIYNGSFAATQYSQLAGVHRWFNSASGTAGNTITFTQAMTLDASGNLGIGTSSPNAKLEAVSNLPIHGLFRNPVASSYTSLRLYNDQNSNVRALEIDYTGSSYSGGEMAFIATTGAYPLTFATNNTERMRLDSSGNLGLGVTPSAWVSGYKAIETGSGSLVYPGSATNTQLWNNLYVNTSGNVTYKSTGIGGLYSIGGGGNAHTWYYAASGTAGTTATLTQTMTLDASGNLLVGTTVATGGLLSGFNAIINGGATYTNIGHSSGTGSGSTYIQFAYAGTTIGSIAQSGTTAVLYNITSDQRLKENIADAASASALIDAIQVRQYDWKSDGSHQRYGFIAQELATVAPEAVHQPADPEEMMAVDYSKLVPMLVKEIQSLRARVAQLESK